MAKIQNIRIEKKPDKYKGPKVVNIRCYIKDWYREQLEDVLENYEHVVIIGRRNKAINGQKGQVYTSLSPSDLLYAIEQVKNSIL